MLTTISEQSQLLSPKKLLALQRQVPISDSQQRLDFSICSGQRSITSIEDSSQATPKGFPIENFSTSLKKEDNDGYSVTSISNTVSNIDSQQLPEENRHHNKSRSSVRSFSRKTSVGND